MGWSRKGCHIDNCIHWLTGTKKETALRRVWETVGALEEHTEFAVLYEHCRRFARNAVERFRKDEGGTFAIITGR